MTKRILIFGGSGYLGTHIALGLSDFFPITITGRRTLHPEISSKLRKSNINYSLFESEQTRIAYNLISDHDIIIVLIPNTQPNFSNSYSKSDISKVVNFTNTVFDFAVQKHKKIIFSSSGGSIYGNKHAFPIPESSSCEPITKYGAIKLELENKLREKTKEFGTNYLILRISNPFGGTFKGYFKNGFINNSINKLLEKNSIEIWGSGNQIRDFIHIKDMVKIINELVRFEANGTFNIGSGVGVSINEVIDQIENLLKLEVKVNRFENFIEPIECNILDMTKVQKIIGEQRIQSLKYSLNQEFIELGLLPMTLN